MTNLVARVPRARRDGRLRRLGPPLAAPPRHPQGLAPHVPLVPRVIGVVVPLRREVEGRLDSSVTQLCGSGSLVKL